FLARLTHPGQHHDDRGHDSGNDQDELRADDVRYAQDDLRADRQVGAEGAVKIRKRRDDLEDDDPDQDERERDENGWINQGRYRLAFDGRDDLRVLDVPAKHGVEVAAALAGEQRRVVHTWKQIALCPEGVRQGGPR